ncbi:hypothetical protein [Pararobbsia silviterrae]|uniref:hypothetical protein n=1 Tax=Pararobbsia silviterrae TaxID=1792498 RepID=UPI0011C47054|nr:hypothetical protein [Pararobbsia silviterrae]
MHRLARVPRDHRVAAFFNAGFVVFALLPFSGRLLVLFACAYSLAAAIARMIAPAFAYTIASALRYACPISR